MSQVVTGDAVVLDLRPARVPTRLLSKLIDLLLMSGAIALYAYVIQGIGGSSARQDAVAVAGSLIILLGYPIGMETITRGRTVGAYALGLRVVRDDGGAIRFRQALLRGLAFLAVDFSVVTGFCGGIVCAAINPQGKRLGDLMAGTMVIRLRAPRPPKPIPPVPAHLAAWAGRLELSSLPDDLVTAARHFVQRYPGMIAHPREQLAYDLARQMADRLAPPPPPDTPPHEFLAAVVAERRRREALRLAAAGSGGWVPRAADLPAGWR